MQNIAFLGHSTACWANYDIFGQRSYIDSVIEHFDFNLISLGVREGSEERILDKLKQLKDVDIAIIFHSKPKYLYLPECNRDIDITKFDQRKAEYLWKAENLHHLEETYFSFGGIRESFQDIELFLNTLNLYKKYLWSPEVHQNRFYGSLIQIDQYCKARNIKCVHIPITDNIPSWFKFTSGECRPDIQEIVDYYHDVGYPNSINAEGQRVMAEKLISVIEQL